MIYVVVPDNFRSVRVIAAMINLKYLVKHNLETLISSHWNTQCIDHHTTFIDNWNTNLPLLLYKNHLEFE